MNSQLRIYYTFQTTTLLRNRVQQDLAQLKRKLIFSYSDKEYRSFEDRVRNVYKRFRSIPTQIVNRWITDKIPGFIVYVTQTEYNSTSFNDSNLYFKLGTKSNITAIDALIKVGIIILTKLYMTPFDGYEVYRSKELVVANMPQHVKDAIILNEIKIRSLINPFSPGVIVVKIGNVCVSKNLPNHLSQLDQRLNGYSVYGSDGKILLQNLKYFTTSIVNAMSVSGIFGTIQCTSIDDGCELFVVTPNVLLSDNDSIIQSTLLEKCKNKGIMFISYDKVKRYEIKSASKIMYISTFFNVYDLSERDFEVHDYFKMLIYATDISNPLMYDELISPTITLCGYESYALRIQTKIIESQLKDTFIFNGMFNLCVIAAKGAGKTSIIRLMKENLNLQDVEIFDSDDYGKWLTLKKANNESPALEIVDQVVSYFEILASEYMRKYGDTCNNLNVRRMFTTEYVNLLESEEFGVSSFIKSMMVDKNSHIIYFAHTTYEGNALPNNFRYVKISVLFDTRMVMKHRKDSRDSKIQVWLHDTYEMINASRPTLLWLEFLTILFGGSLGWD